MMCKARDTRLPARCHPGGRCNQRRTRAACGRLAVRTASRPARGWGGRRWRGGGEGAGGGPREKGLYIAYTRGTKVLSDRYLYKQ